MANENNEDKDKEIQPRVDTKPDDKKKAYDTKPTEKKSADDTKPTEKNASDSSDAALEKAVQAFMDARNGKKPDEPKEDEPKADEHHGESEDERIARIVASVLDEHDKKQQEKRASDSSSAAAIIAAAVAGNAKAREVDPWESLGESISKKLGGR